MSLCPIVNNRNDAIRVLENALAKLDKEGHDVPSVKIGRYLLRPTTTRLKRMRMSGGVPPRRRSTRNNPIPEPIPEYSSSSSSSRSSTQSRSPIRTGFSRILNYLPFTRKRRASRSPVRTRTYFDRLSAQMLNTNTCEKNMRIIICATIILSMAGYALPCVINVINMLNGCSRAEAAFNASIIGQVYNSVSYVLSDFLVLGRDAIYNGVNFTTIFKALQDFANNTTGKYSSLVMWAINHLVGGGGIIIFIKWVMTRFSIDYLMKTIKTGYSTTFKWVSTIVKYLSNIVSKSIKMSKQVTDTLTTAIRKAYTKVSTSYNKMITQMCRTYRTVDFPELEFSESKVHNTKVMAKFSVTVGKLFCLWLRDFFKFIHAALYDERMVVTAVNVNGVLEMMNSTGNASMANSAAIQITDGPRRTRRRATPAAAQAVVEVDPAVIEPIVVEAARTRSASQASQASQHVSPIIEEQPARQPRRRTAQPRAQTRVRTRAARGR